MNISMGEMEKGRLFMEKENGDLKGVMVRIEPV